VTDLLLAPETAADEPDPDPAPARRPRRRHFRRTRQVLRSRTVRVILVACALVGVVLGRSISLALTAPGTDSLSARMAIWARDHRAGALVNLGERLAYKPPKVGGAPAEAIAATPAGHRESKAAGPAPAAPILDLGGHPLPSGGEPDLVKLAAFEKAAAEAAAQAAAAQAAAAAAAAAAAPKGLPAPDPIAPIAGTPIADEGVWQTLESAGGIPLVRAAYLRADSVYTSYLSAVAWMDTKMLGFNLQPGTSDPGGGPWPVGASLPPGERRDVVAAFNSAFRMVDSRGGFYLAGKTVGTMRDGAATIVFYNDGSVQVGAWNVTVKMTPDVLGARQNLDLIVDGGQVNRLINDNSGNRWGATLGNDLYVWRSGVGVTATGALVYATGPRLSAESLAQLLVRAGAIRAMELDINPSWTIFVHYAATPDGSVPNKLMGGMQRPATVYDTPNSRDFIVARLR
jgi:phosphodiester glycosidase